MIFFFLTCSQKITCPQKKITYSQKLYTHKKNVRHLTSMIKCNKMRYKMNENILSSYLPDDPFDICS